MPQLTASPAASTRQALLSDDGTASPELRGYLFWGPIALTITATELLGVGDVQEWIDENLGLTIPWPTISSTVGHLQERWNAVAALVVFAIGVIGFSALAYRDPEDKTYNGRTLPRDRPRESKVRYYSWQFSLPAVVAGWIASFFTEDKLVLGYVIYGAFAIYGVIVPSLLVRFASKEVNFPTLFFTFAKLRSRYAWVAATFVGLLAVLVLHLALYPWPSIAKEP
jgi:hypothetical protein